MLPTVGKQGSGSVTCSQASWIWEVFELRSPDFSGHSKLCHLIVKAHWDVKHMLVDEGSMFQLKEYSTEEEDLVIHAG